MDTTGITQNLINHKRESKRLTISKRILELAKTLREIERELDLPKSLEFLKAIESVKSYLKSIGG